MRLRRRKHRRVPGINTASVADISFTLLILFLVVTSMDDDKGLSRMLPPPTSEEQTKTEITKRNVLNIRIGADDKLAVNDEMVSLQQLKKRVMNFVDNPQNLDSLPEKHPCEIELLGSCMITDGHVIQLQADQEGRYETYFMVQNTIVEAYRQLRDSLCVAHFGMPYAKCNELQREAAKTYYPQRVAEVYQMKGGEP